MTPGPDQRPRLSRSTWPSAEPATETGAEPTSGSAALPTLRTAPAPVRIVHLGLGAFHRSHQAWFTHTVDPRHEWGIASFTGRSPRLAEELQPQDGLFALIERAATGDTVTVVSSIVEAVDGADLDRLVELIAAPTTAIVTLTVTEAGYHVTTEGRLDTGDTQVAADIRTIGRRVDAARNSHSDDSPGPTTALGRLLLGLAARRATGGGPIAIVPCDNLPANGTLVSDALQELANSAAPALGLAEWITQNVSFVSTSVDRITPRATDADRAEAAHHLGLTDEATVVAEPFADWILSGAFPAGRPDWQNAGARFVDDIEPFENRKLWLLNGAHSLLAYTGLMRRHTTVAEAMADPECRALVTAWWGEARPHLQGADLELPGYCAALLDRFDNPRIEHRLAQIGESGVAKLGVRIVPALLAERAAGRRAPAAIAALSAWIALLLESTLLENSPLDGTLLENSVLNGTLLENSLLKGTLLENPPLNGTLLENPLPKGTRLADAHSDAITSALSLPRESAIPALLHLVDARLIGSPGLVADVELAVESWRATSIHIPLTRTPGDPHS